MDSTISLPKLINVLQKTFIYYPWYPLKLFPLNYQLFFSFLLNSPLFNLPCSCILLYKPLYPTFNVTTSPLACLQVSFWSSFPNRDINLIRHSSSCPSKHIYIHILHCHLHHSLSCTYKYLSLKGSFCTITLHSIEVQSVDTSLLLFGFILFHLL